MKKITLLIGFILASSLVSAGWLDEFTTAVGGHVTDLTSRFKANEVVDGTILKRTKFRENDRGQDTLHRGSGSVFIVDTPQGRFLQLAPDFSSTPGPDYHVYISQETNIDHEDRFVKAQQIELGRLIKGSGASYYPLPADTAFKSVTIWCKTFNEFIVSADFES